uniref:Uncharacterized protein n=1 Tax=Oryza nivara TaxID=4536 RepID=A0A0E0FQK5_ORYNI
MTQRMELQEGVVLGGGISFSTGPDDMRLILTLAAAGKRYLRAHRVTVLDLTDACSWCPIMCSSPPPPAAPHRCRTLRPPGPRQRPPRCRHLVLGSGIARCSFPVKDGRVTGDSDSDQPVPTRCKQARDSVRRAKGKGTT